MNSKTINIKERIFLYSQIVTFHYTPKEWNSPNVFHEKLTLTQWQKLHRAESFEQCLLQCMSLETMLNAINVDAIVSGGNWKCVMKRKQLREAAVDLLVERGLLISGCRADDFTDIFLVNMWGLMMGNNVIVLMFFYCWGKCSNAFWWVFWILYKV